MEPFTDTYGVDQDIRKRKWTSGRTAISQFLRSWTGLICMSSTPLGLRALVESLALPDLYMNEITLDCFFVIFHLPLTRGSDASFNRAKAVVAPTAKVVQAPRQHSLLQNYLAVLLSVLMSYGLPKTLIKLCRRMNERAVVQEGGLGSRAIAHKATLLLSEILNLGNQVLPPSQCAQLQGLPQLMRDALTFTLDPQKRSVASTNIGDLEKLALIQRSAASEGSGGQNRLDYFDEIRKNFDWNMDEASVKQKMNESVLMKKDFGFWDWETISELIEGPLSNPLHYGTPLATRFVKRVISFFWPSSKAFCNLPAGGVRSALVNSSGILTSLEERPLCPHRLCSD